ncbi:unnamed protein product [Urochloa humidicola]
MASTKKPASSAWSDLPSDLFCLVLWRLHSLADRVRVAVVCRPWRSAARLQLQEPPLPPLMPWLALGGEDYLDLVTGTDHELRALKIPDDASCGGSVDHLLFLTSDDGGCFLADPFSGAVVPIADLAFFVKEQTPEELPSLTYSLRVKVRKVVVHWPPQGSPAGGGGPIVAALITKPNRFNKHNKHKTIFVCRAGAETSASKESYGAKSAHADSSVKDIAFFRGKLYALTMNKDVIVFEIAEGSGGNPTISDVKYVIEHTLGITEILDAYSGSDEQEDWWALPFANSAFCNPCELYLVPSGDQLLMVRRWSEFDGPFTSCFEVYEADLAASPCRWTLACSLDGRALFLGRCGSKTIPAASRRNSEPRGDCIYFLRGQGSESGVYDMWTHEIRQLGKDGNALPWGGWNPTWVFPDRSASGSGRY